MRALVFIANLVVIAIAWQMSSLTGMLLVGAVSFVLIAATFAFSTARKEARESKTIQRAMGRNSTYLAGLDR